MGRHPCARYPQWGILDFDAPDLNFVKSIISKIGLQNGEYLLQTSPSYDSDGSSHLLFIQELDAKPITYKQFINCLCNAVVFKLGKIELFPSTRRGVRLPFGYKQDLISNNDMTPIELPLEEKLYWFDKISPFDLSKWYYKKKNDNNPLQKEIDFDYEINLSKSKSKGAFLLENGIQAIHTRHYSLFKIACFLFAKNYPKKLIKWQRHKHNGLSQTINEGKWDEACKDTKQITEWVYDNLEHRAIYPDTVHINRYGIYKSDMYFITKTFYGNIIMQKRLFKLTLHA